MVSFRIKKEEYDRLKELSNTKGKPVAQFIREIVLSTIGEKPESYNSGFDKKKKREEEKMKWRKTCGICDVKTPGEGDFFFTKKDILVGKDGRAYVKCPANHAVFLPYQKELVKSLRSAITERTEAEKRKTQVEVENVAPMGIGEEDIEDVAEGEGKKDMWTVTCGVCKRKKLRKADFFFMEGDILFSNNGQAYVLCPVGHRVVIPWKKKPDESLTNAVERRKEAWKRRPVRIRLQNTAPMGKEAEGEMGGEIEGEKCIEDVEDVKEDESETIETADMGKISKKLSEIEHGKTERRNTLVIEPKWMLPGTCKIMHAFGEDLAVCKSDDGKIRIFEVMRTYEWEREIF